MACIEIEENSVFELCGGLIDDWKEEGEQAKASGLSNEHTEKQGKNDYKAKAITSLVKTFDGLKIIEQDCSDRKLNSEINDMQTKLKTKIERDIANYRQKRELEREFDVVKNRYLADLIWKDYSESRKVLMRLKPHQPGCSMRCWKEAKFKIDKVHQSEARGVLLNYIAQMEALGLPIAKESVDLTVRLVNKPVKKGRKVDRNCKHIESRRRLYYRKFQTKLSQEVALGMINHDKPMVNYDAVHLQLSCPLVDFIRCNYKMVEKSNSINEYSIWYGI